MSEKGPLSRRDFLHMVGAAGGVAAVNETLVALGLMRHPAAWAGPPRCEPGTGDGKRVLILGGGVGGLGLAYWLQKCGYAVTVLEAEDRLGGRNHTARQGSVVHEVDSEQQCRFDRGLYLNLGPGRIPYYHRRVLDLCRELGVELEVYVHTSDINLQGTRGMETYDRRRLEYDAQGYISELLTKAINQGALDRELTEGDRERLKSLLQKFGDLRRDGHYRGTTRAGCRVPLDVGIGCPSRSNMVARLGLDTLLRTEFWNPCRLGSPDRDCDQMDRPYGFYQVDELLWQTTSFQPAGGMDRIVDALEEKLRAGGAEIVCGSVVRAIRDLPRTRQIAVEVAGKEPFVGDFCASNIPFSIYPGIATPGLEPDFRGAIDRRTFSNACKVGWQADRRFWELDKQIYGGISWTQHTITQMWYPSNDYFAAKGTLTGAYNYGETARHFGELAPERRLDLAYAGGRELHGDAFAEAIRKELGISIAWQKVRYQQGCSVQWILPGDSPEVRQQKTDDYRRLLRPAFGGRLFVVGDQISSLPAWQEGALMSAEHVLGQITRGEALSRERLEQEVKEAPMSLEVIG